MSRRLADLTSEELTTCLRASAVVVLVPVGSVEPHGPHLPLGADTIISETCAFRAADRLAEEGVVALVAPSVPYGVTDFAAGFNGALGIPASALTPLLRGIAEKCLATGTSHVCFVNNHLEPAHDAAVRAAIEGLPDGSASVACPLMRRWARTLSDEFKRGECHAGRYETSLLLAADANVRDVFTTLPAVPISLSDGIRAGRSTFVEMGMTEAYAGAPREASREEGEELYEKLVTMIVTEVREGLAKR